MKKHNKPFLFSGLVSIGLAYLLIVAILVLILILTPLDLNIFIGIFSVVTILCGAAAVAICLFSQHIAKVDATAKTKLQKGDYKSPKRGGF